MSSLNKRLDELDRRLDEIEETLDEMDNRLAALESSQKQLVISLSLLCQVKPAEFSCHESSCTRSKTSEDISPCFMLQRQALS